MGGKQLFSSLVSWSLVMLLSGCTFSPEEMKEATVRVVCKDASDMTLGSGVVIGDRYVVTNAHVVQCEEQKAGRAAVLLGQRELSMARVAWRDTSADLVILSVDEPLNRPFPALMIYQEPPDDETVFALGFPSDSDETADMEGQLTAKTTRGGISAKITGMDNRVHYYQIDAPINPGNSGGPLFNEAGHLIGINVAKSMVNVISMQPNADGKPVATTVRVPSAEGIAWAISVDELLPGLRKLKIPYTLKRPGLFSTIVRSTKREPVAATLLALILTVPLCVGLSLLLKRQQLPWRVLRFPLRLPSPAPQPQPIQKRLMLYGVSGPFAGKCLEVPEHPLVMGRDPQQCQLVFPSACTVISHRHAAIRYDPQGRVALLEDCGSKYGTFLGDGEALQPHRSYALTPGIPFHLVSIEYQFVCMQEDWKGTKH